jgi:hypothetical protein
MTCSLVDHLNYVHAADAELHEAWRGEDLLSYYPHLQTLARIDAYRSTLPESDDDMRRLHSAAAGLLAQRCTQRAETEVRELPPAGAWIRLARDPTRLKKLYARAVRQLTRLIGASADKELVLYYGGIKPRASIERALRKYSSGRGVLDLLDLVRFRIVAADIQSVHSFSDTILDHYEGRVLRYRNYYLKPRDGWDDPYRAVHFALQVDTRDDAAIVEVQVLTLARDSVGMIDHAVVHERAIPFLGWWHEQWLLSVSYSANILDAQMN